MPASPLGTSGAATPGGWTTHRDSTKGFSVSVPPGWRYRSGTDGPPGAIALFEIDDDRDLPPGSPTPPAVRIVAVETRAVPGSLAARPDRFEPNSERLVTTISVHRGGVEAPIGTATQGLFDFVDHGRSFEILVHSEGAGPASAPPEQAFAALDTLRVVPSTRLHRPSRPPRRASRLPQQLIVVFLDAKGVDDNGLAASDAARVYGGLGNVIDLAGNAQRIQNGTTVTCKPGYEALAAATARQAPTRATVELYPNPAPSVGATADCIITIGQ